MNRKRQDSVGELSGAGAPAKRTGGPGECAARGHLSEHHVQPGDGFRPDPGLGPGEPGRDHPASSEPQGVSV